MLPYYTKDKVLTKDMIFQNEMQMMYIPDNPKLATIPREFLLSILDNIKREKYAALYSRYKQIKVERAIGGKKIYQVQITNEFFNGIQNFSPINL